jgi:membrane-bound ClpP family serine protease
MSLSLIAAFLVIGLILIIIEVLVTPGIVVGAIGVMFMGFGIYKTYTDYGVSAGNWTLFIMFVVAIGAIVLALRSGAWQRMSNKSVLDGKMNVVDMEKIQPGDEGITLSALRPGGNALINGQRVEVTTIGETLDADLPILVKEIRQNKIYVKAK